MPAALLNIVTRIIPNTHVHAERKIKQYPQ